MRRPPSLSLRLTLLFGITTAIVFSIFGLVIVQSTQGHFIEEDSDELQVIAHAVQDVVTSAGVVDGLGALEQRFDDILVGHHNASLHIAAPDGRTVYASSGPDLSGIMRSLGVDGHSPAVHSRNIHGHTYRVLMQSMPQAPGDNAQPLAVVVAVPIDHHQRFLKRFQRNLWLMIAASIVLTSAMGWIAVRRGHAPLRDIVDKIHRISADELSTRLSPASVPRELTELAVSFNGMLERVDKAFHRLSDFNADMAHELRTPVANLMTQTQVALTRARTIDEYREILYSNIEEYERMAQMVGDMLFLAQTDNPQHHKNFIELDLAGEIEALIDFYEGWADERGVTLALTGNATVSGDRLMLQRAFGNLLSNAIRHTPSGGTVQVNVQSINPGEVDITVENPGAVIPHEHIPRLFDRFYRVDPSRQQGEQGVGLGLAIVASIVAAHDGRIRVESDAGLTRFTLTLPD